MSFYRPDEIQSPGDHLSAILEDLGFSVSAFIVRSGIAPKYFYRILGGQAPLSGEAIERIAKWTKTSVRFWELREERWQKAQEQLRLIAELDVDET
jgi:plasmid maintenance system antidote protein VapI